MVLPLLPLKSMSIRPLTLHLGDNQLTSSDLSWVKESICYVLEKSLQFTEEKIKQNIKNTCFKTASSFYIIYNKTDSNKHYVLCGNDFKWVFWRNNFVFLESIFLNKIYINGWFPFTRYFTFCCLPRPIIDVYSSPIFPFYFILNYQANNVKLIVVISKVFFATLKGFPNLELGLHIVIGFINILWKHNNYTLIAFYFWLTKKNYSNP